MIWHVQQNAVKCFIIPLPRLAIYTDLFTLIGNDVKLTQVIRLINTICCRFFKVCSFYIIAE